MNQAAQLSEITPPARADSRQATSAAHIVASALESIVSDLMGSALQTRGADSATITLRQAAVLARGSTGTREAYFPDKPKLALSAGSNDLPGEDDHSYQWRAFQEDDDAGPVNFWTDDEVEEPFAPDAPKVKVDLKAAEAPADVAFHEPASGNPSRVADLPAGLSLDLGARTLFSPSPGTPGEGRQQSSNDPDQPVLAGASRGGGWTIPVLCAGIGLIACCLLIPLCDANRRVAYDKMRLRRDLASLQHQVATNDQFLHKVADDPTLAERLAQRQLKKVRPGTHRVPLKDDRGASQSAADFGSMSPFGIVAVPPPAPLAPYQPVGGRIATLCYDPHTRLSLLGAGMMLLAGGLVMGYGPLGIGRGNAGVVKT